MRPHALLSIFIRQEPQLVTMKVKIEVKITSEIINLSLSADRPHVLYEVDTYHPHTFQAENTGYSIFLNFEKS